MFRVRHVLVVGSLGVVVVGALRAGEAAPPTRSALAKPAPPTRGDATKRASRPKGDATVAAGGSCPGTGDCCQPNGTPGCDDLACCTFVTNLEPLCGSIGWTQTCADFASTFCAAGTCAGGCPGAGSCCTAHQSAGCDDPTCCDLVCSNQSFCCDGVWTADCAARARILCPTLCPTDPCPGTGECCLGHASPGCRDEACCDVVCAEDSFCCEAKWDGLCAALARLLCGATCAGPCPAPGDCCNEHAGGGCEDPECCAAVCASEPTCCDGPWGAHCAAAAATECPALCSSGCPGIGDCCSTHSGSGCEDRACCEAVCNVDDFCCFVPWDSSCVSIAREVCPDVCGAPNVCPSAGACCSAHGAAGCEEPDCCERVCGASPACCSDVWSEACAELADVLCEGQCRCASTGDLDSSGAIDLRDVAAFQRCFTGAGAGSLPLDCACADAAGDGDVDYIDLRAFLELGFGPTP